LPKILPTLFVHVGIALSLAGCNSEASQQAEAQRHLDAALATLGEANAGYIVRAEGDGGGGGLQAYRQETMASALEDLNKVMTLNAPPQQVQALRKLAEINASAAMHEAGLAADENAVLGGRSTSLQGYLMALEGSAVRSVALEPLTEDSLIKLQEEIERQTATREQLTSEVTELGRKLESVTAKVQAFKGRADEGNAQAQALREKAFVSQGEQMYDLQDQAAELEREAAIESAAGEQEQVIATDLSGRLRLTQALLDTTNQLLDELEGQVKATRIATARQADASAKALADSREAAKTLAEEFEQIVEVHQSAIQKRMTEAGVKIDKAVTDLKQAVQIAQNLPDRKAAAANVPMAQLQLLAAYVDQAHVATSHAQYLGDLAGMTESLALSIRRATPEDAAEYTERFEQLNQSQKVLNEKASEAIKAGQALALELAPEGSTPGDGKVESIALKQMARLAEYDKLDGGPAVQ
jgi:hypothetical protein